MKLEAQRTKIIVNRYSNFQKICVRWASGGIYENVDGTTVLLIAKFIYIFFKLINFLLCKQVEQERENDAKEEIEIAKVLDGFIKRKVIFKSDR